MKTRIRVQTVVVFGSFVHWKSFACRVVCCDLPAEVLTHVPTIPSGGPSSFERMTFGLTYGNCRQEYRHSASFSFCRRQSHAAVDTWFVATAYMHVWLRTFTCIDRWTNTNRSVTNVHPWRCGYNVCTVTASTLGFTQVYPKNYVRLVNFHKKRSSQWIVVSNAGKRRDFEQPVYPASSSSQNWSEIPRYLESVSECS